MLLVNHWAVVECIFQEVLYCAKKAGATHILKAGGAQVWKLRTTFSIILCISTSFFLNMIDNVAQNDAEFSYFDELLQAISAMAWGTESCPKVWVSTLFVCF